MSGVASRLDRHGRVCFRCSGRLSGVSGCRAGVGRGGARGRYVDVSEGARRVAAEIDTCPECGWWLFVSSTGCSRCGWVRPSSRGPGGRRAVSASPVETGRAVTEEGR